MKYPFTQTADSSTPFKSRLVASLASLEHQFNMFKANMESKVATLLANIADHTRIIDQNRVMQIN